jgi:hypothetical protein
MKDKGILDSMAALCHNDPTEDDKKPYSKKKVFQSVHSTEAKKRPSCEQEENQKEPGRARKEIYTIREQMVPAFAGCWNLAK